MSAVAPMDPKTAAGLVTISAPLNKWYNYRNYTNGMIGEKKYSTVEFGGSDFDCHSTAGRTLIWATHKTYFSEQLTGSHIPGASMIRDLDLIFFPNFRSASGFVHNTKSEGARQELVDLGIIRVAVGTANFSSDCFKDHKNWEVLPHTLEKDDLSVLSELMQAFGSLTEILLVCDHECIHQAPLTVEANRKMAEIMRQHEEQWDAADRKRAAKGKSLGTRWPHP